MILIELVATAIVMSILTIVSHATIIDNFINTFGIEGILYLGFSTIYSILALTLIIATVYFKTKITNALVIFILSINLMFVISLQSQLFIPILVALPYFLLIEIE